MPESRFRFLGLVVVGSNMTKSGCRDKTVKILASSCFSLNWESNIMVVYP